MTDLNTEDQVEPVAMSDDAMGAIYDKLQGDAPDEPPAEVVADEPVEEPEVKAEETPEAPEAPGDLPKGVKDHWAEIPESAREAIAASQKEMSQKLSESGRLTTGLKPVQDVLVRAAKEMPHLADMTPADVADHVFALAQISHRFNSDPVGAMMGLIKEHGMEAKVAQALSGTPATNAEQHVETLQQEIAGLKKQLAGFSAPDQIQGLVDRALSQRDTEAAINKFASEAEHWSAVEDYLPVTIPLVQAKLGESASAQDVLSQAYDLALSQFVPDAVKAQEKAAAEAVQPDPEKAEAARKAKSVNVKSGPTDKPRTVSETQLLGQVWDRMQA